MLADGQNERGDIEPTVKLGAVRKKQERPKDAGTSDLGSELVKSRSKKHQQKSN